MYNPSLYIKKNRIDLRLVLKSVVKLFQFLQPPLQRMLTMLDVTVLLLLLMGTVIEQDADFSTPRPLYHTPMLLL